MGSRAKIVSIENKEIYQVDYSGIRNYNLFNDAINETGEFRDQLIQTKKRNLLLLVDLTGSAWNMDIYDKLRKHGHLTRPITKKAAVVGLNKICFIVNIYNMVTGMNFRYFQTRREALTWLLTEK